MHSPVSYNSEKKIWRGPNKVAWLFNEKANLGRIILSFLARDPRKVAQISDNNGIRMTNRELSSDTEKIAGGLRRRGCQRGDVVGFMARNGHNLTPTLFACFLLEAPTHAMDIHQEENEIYGLFSITKPKFIFCDDEKIPLAEKVVKRLHNSPTIIVYGRKVPNYIHIEDLMREGDSDELRKEIYEESCRESEAKYHIIVSSSGTTGPSKAVCVPYQTLLVPHWTKDISSTSTEYLFSFCTLFWSVSYLVLFMSVFQGITRIITTETFSPELYIHIITKYKVTHTIMSPLFLEHILNSPKFTSSSLYPLKYIWVGGNIISEQLLRKLLPHIPSKDLLISYGMSETGGISRYLYDPTRSVNVGFIDPGIEGIVVDEEGRKLGPGEQGEICFKTPYSLFEYMGNPEATAALRDSEGYLHTGDLGYYDEDGYLRIVGRCKDVIKYFMDHVSGSEIERVVGNLPGVLQVAAVGIPDEKCYQLPAVVIVKQEGASIVEKEVSEVVARELPNSHRLRGGVYFIDKLAKTYSGKLKKKEIEKYAKEQYFIMKKREYI
ncbi:uncharacterized protein LOC129800247 [Phlebotomus papatasi]|uniref:uncharacterized protein LOC129800247 n=1 Tax=Phlebotomus papatasi TaxID=29031 RepID=UPI0024839A3D|nr:uncharacterized protein LOC129800247 [Phlebotomus papatasi]